MDTPFIRLKDLFEEPSGRGWGLDIRGWGLLIRFNYSNVHVISVKTSNYWYSRDMRVRLNKDRIEFLEDGLDYCLEARYAKEGSPVDARKCLEMKNGKWKDINGQLNLLGTNLCLTVFGRVKNPWRKVKRGSFQGT